MKKKSKQLISLILALVLVVSMLPVGMFTAYANYAANATVLGASDYYSAAEVPANAFDPEPGTKTHTKWCDVATSGWIAFKTAEVVTPYSLKVFHANSSDINWDKDDAGNTQDYELQILADGKVLPDAADATAYKAFLADDTNWTAVSTVTGNTQAIRQSLVTMTEARDVYRLNVTNVGVDKNGNKENAIRIYDIQLLSELESAIEYTVSFTDATGAALSTMTPLPASNKLDTPLPAPSYKTPDGMEFAGWELVDSTKNAVIKTNPHTICPQEDVTVKPVYVAKPAGTPTDNQDGTHTYPTGETFVCTCCYYSSTETEHTLKCNCGKSMAMGFHHSSTGSVSDGNGRHHLVCDTCGTSYDSQPCGNFSYTDSGDGQKHIKKCGTCGYEVAEEHTPSFYNVTPNGDGTHNAYCEECNAEMKNIPCISYGNYRATADGSMHEAICDYCNKAIPNTEAPHTTEYHYTEYAGNHQHYVMCDDCYYPVSSEACTESEEFYHYNNNYHSKCCIECGGAFLDTIQKHNYVYSEDLDPVPGLENYKVAGYRCKDCDSEEALFYTNTPGKYFIAIKNNWENTNPNISLTVIVNGEEKIVDLSSQYVNGIEVNKTDDVAVVLNKSGNDSISYYIIDCDTLNIVDYNFEVRREINNGDIIWQNINSKLADFTKLNAAKATVPENLSAYSPRSVLNLQKALDNIPPSYTIDQNYVDNSTAEIIKAVEGLELKENAKAEDVANIAIPDDGVLVITETGYSIDGAPEVPFTGRYELSNETQGNCANHIVIESGYHDITINNLVVYPNDSSGDAGIDIQTGSSVYLTYKGTENNISTEYDDSDAAAIRVPFGSSLFLYGEEGAYLTAYGDNNCAGIGSNNKEDAGNITIFNGDLNAKSRNDAAGIGGGDSGNCGHIKIYDGNIKAECKDEDGAGIGNGDDGNGGIIEIFGGNIEALSKDDDGAGIGGADNGDVELIRITGGNITAKTDDGAAIGGGDDGGDLYRCKIEIANATLNLSSNSGTCIGAGSSETAGDITVVDTTIFYDRADDFVIGQDNPSISDDKIRNVKLDNVTIFQKTGEDANGNPIYSVTDQCNKVSPAPTTLDGNEVVFITKEVDYQDGEVNIILPDGKQIPAHVVDGKINVAVDKKYADSIDQVKVGTRTANYRVVYDAIDTIPADLTIYTDESVAALEAIVDSVDYTLAPEKQAEVNEIAIQILAAVDKLEIKEADANNDDSTVPTPSENDDTVKSPSTGSEANCAFASIVSCGLACMLLSTMLKKRKKKTNR